MFADASNSRLASAPAWLTSRTFLRPKRSDSCPSQGAAMNWASPSAPNTRPSTSGVAPMSLR